MQALGSGLLVWFQSFEVLITSGELMPTTVRAAGVGSSSLVSKVGGTLSTTVAALADIHPAIPTLIFTVMAITSGALTMFLPETKDRKMPDSLDDVNRCAYQDISIFRF